MTTRYIDPTEFMAAHGHTAEVENAKLGHVHLQVGDVAGARRFYVDGLGFDETATLAGQALFVSTGGYHHHLAMNVWGTAGTGERTPSLGLGVIDLSLPTRADLDARIEPVTASVLSDDGRTVTLTDPWKNLVRITATTV